MPGLEWLLLVVAGAAILFCVYYLRQAQAPSPVRGSLEAEGLVMGHHVSARLFDGACSGYRAEQNGQVSLLLRLQDAAAPSPTPGEVQAFLAKWKDVRSNGLIPMRRAEARQGGLWILVPWTEARPWKRDSAASQLEPFGRGRSLLDALTALHEQGVIHGRVTPVWLLVEGETVHLLPPAPIHRDPRQLQTLHSSALYLPPEEIKGDKAETPWSDQYGAGVTLALLLDAQQIYKRQNDFMGILQSKVEPRFNLRFAEPVPEAVQDVIKRMLAPLPENRFPSMAEARAAYLQAIPR
ncbi:MAG: protein kinase domain-containing protein [Candidatus Xenobia bacterium]